MLTENTFCAINTEKDIKISRYSCAPECLHVRMYNSTTRSSFTWAKCATKHILYILFSCQTVKCCTLTFLVKTISERHTRTHAHSHTNNHSNNQQQQQQQKYEQQTTCCCCLWGMQQHKNLLTKAKSLSFVAFVVLSSSSSFAASTSFDKSAVDIADVCFLCVCERKVSAVVSVCVCVCALPFVAYQLTYQ